MSHLLVSEKTSLCNLIQCVSWRALILHSLFARFTRVFGLNHLRCPSVDLIQTGSCNSGYFGTACASQARAVEMRGNFTHHQQQRNISNHYPFPPPHKNTFPGRISTILINAQTEIHPCAKYCLDPSSIQRIHVLCTSHLLTSIGSRSARAAPLHRAMAADCAALTARVRAMPALWAPRASLFVRPDREAALAAAAVLVVLRSSAVVAAIVNYRRPAPRQYVDATPDISARRVSRRVRAMRPACRVRAAASARPTDSARARPAIGAQRYATRLISLSALDPLLS